MSWPQHLVRSLWAPPPFLKSFPDEMVPTFPKVFWGKSDCGSRWLQSFSKIRQGKISKMVVVPKESERDVSARTSCSTQLCFDCFSHWSNLIWLTKAQLKLCEPSWWISEVKVTAKLFKNSSAKDFKNGGVLQSQLPSFFLWWEVLLQDYVSLHSEVDRTWFGLCGNRFVSDKNWILAFVSQSRSVRTIATGFF